MNANTAAPSSASASTPASASASAPVGPRFDQKFIEEHHLIDRYLMHKLPPKGALELENWCRANPQYVEGLGLAERAEASLALLDAMGRPADLSEPKTPWWGRPPFIIGLATVTALSLLGFWALYGKLVLLRGELSETQVRLTQGPLVQPTTEVATRVSPDRAAGLGHAHLLVNRSNPQLVTLHIDMSYSKAMEFRMVVDKQDQGRALILNNLTKDSNGELRLTVNTTGLAAGVYSARIESLPFRGPSVAEGWLTLEVH
jgi:hypothetical protein